MTSTMTEPGRWGETRLAQREARRRRTQATIVGAGVLLIAALIAGRLAGIDAGQRVAWLRASVAAGILALVAFALWRTWVEDDEVQWRRSVNGLAAIGAATLVLAVVGDIVRGFGAGYPGLNRHLFLAAAAAGLATLAWQRLRGGRA